MVQPDEVINKYEELRKEGELLRVEVAAERAQYQRTSWKLIFTMVGCILVSVASLILVATCLYLLSDSRQRGLTIKDCVTNPQSECAKANQRNTEAAISRLVQEQQRSIEVYVKCARSTSTDAELDACVAARSKEGAH